MTNYELEKLGKKTAEYFKQMLLEDSELLDIVFPPRFMNIDQASEFTGIPTGTIYQKIGQIPHEKVGKRLVFTDRGLVRWIKRKPSVAEKIEIQPALRKTM